MFGYDAVAYDAQDPSVAVLRVRPASGYREIVITGPIRDRIVILSDHSIEKIDVPDELVTKAPLSTNYSSR